MQSKIHDQFWVVTQLKLGMSIYSIPHGEDGKHPPKQLFQHIPCFATKEIVYFDFMQYYFSAYKTVSCLLGKKKVIGQL